MKKTKICTKCEQPKDESEFYKTHGVCKKCYTLDQRLKYRKKHPEKLPITIPYEPIGCTGRAWVTGESVRLARLTAGITTTYKMALACRWSQTNQVRYEQEGRHKIDLLNVWQMIRACNRGDR